MKRRSNVFPGGRTLLGPEAGTRHGTRLRRLEGASRRERAAREGKPLRGTADGDIHVDASRPHATVRSHVDGTAVGAPGRLTAGALHVFGRSYTGEAPQGDGVHRGVQCCTEPCHGYRDS